MITNGEVYAYGYIAGIIEAAARKQGKSIVSPALFTEACMRPNVGSAKIHFLAMQNHIIGEKTSARIAEIADHINVPEDDRNFCLPPNLQSEWQVGYYHALGGKLSVFEWDKKGIRYRRKIAGLTQKQLADKLGCSQEHISRWENGVVTPSAETLKQIAEILDCSMDMLIEAPDD